MIFLAINWLSLSITTLLFVFILICILMGVVILMQRPKQEGLGAAFGGGVTDQVFGARTTDVLQKTTWVLGSLFLILCFVLAILIGKQNAAKKKSLISDEKEKPVAVAPVTPAPVTPAPVTPAPVTPAPVTPAPATPAPVAPAPDAAPAPVTPPPAPQGNPSDKTE